MFLQKCVVFLHIIKKKLHLKCAFANSNILLIFFIIKSPKQSLGDLLFLLRFLLLSLPNKVWGTYCFCFVSYYYYYYYYSYSSFFPCTMNLSTADLRNYRTEFHETWWSYRYMFLVDPKVFRFVVKGFKGVGVTIESYGKLEISYINVDNF